jgi:F-type H+-transporting ATPase subunit gamma
MATLKDVQTKIGAVKKTKQITKAMNMVATSKLRGAQSVMEAFRPYAGKFAEVLGSLAAKAGEESSALLLPREEVKKINVILCTSDRGLCGGFNANLITKAQKLSEEKTEKGMEISFTNFGKKGRDWCRKNKMQIADDYLGIVGGKFGFNIASVSGKKLIDRFLEGEYDEVYIIFSEFLSMARQVPAVNRFFPFHLLNLLMTPLRMRINLTWQNIFVNLHQKSSWMKCCRAMCMFRFTVHFWKHPRVNMLPG